MSEQEFNESNDSIDTNEDSRKKQIRNFSLVGIGLFLMVLLGLYYSDNQIKKDRQSLSAEIEEQRKKDNEILKRYKFNPSEVVKPEEKWMAKSETEFKVLKEENDSLKERLQRLEEMMEKGPDTSNNTDESVIANTQQSTPVENDQPKVKLSSPLSVESVKASVADGVAEPSIKNKKSTEIGYVDLSPMGSSNQKDKVKKNIETYMPAGAFAKVLVLSGVDAPTGGMAESNPLPVILKVLDSAILPNFFDSDIRNCHVVGAATGDLAAERVMIRTEVLSCVLANGDIIEVPIKGYIAGEDGKNGFRGRVVSKQGAVLAKSLFAGVASGLSNSINSQYQQIQTSALGTVTSIDPDKVAESGAAQGATTTLEKIADFYFKRANEIYPIIEMAPNRIGELVIIKGAKLENALVQDDGNE
ncbi:hypothetical protein HF888_16335 (plasmid) [Bermanella marisrubri]|uniref:TraB pilus assembly n=1 Tax=Bermanella marisrubri TaxID=207949 RepID=Q1MY41_9GAMM|nr:TraB/VirB10 family protein [Bermanella marisrubri]EAT10855.1 TraB pilus assembly [Oceanobacter sp. RED65] [Bermanella marisrubri]QIZ85908.1 hypothetical protein HF888_16335 [Bermanella marisrubri]